MRSSNLVYFICILCIIQLIESTCNETRVKNSTSISSKIWSKINLPLQHLPYFFNSNEKLRQRCLNDENCPYKTQAQSDNLRCWGYEKNCDLEKKLFLPECPGDSRGWTSNKQDQVRLFWEQGDFGYLHQRLSEMRTYCHPESPEDSSLECVDHVRYCRARNIFFDFSSLEATKSHDRYRENVIQKGQVGGKCRFDREAFKQQGDHKSPLQSWYAELEHFNTEAANSLNTCDITISEPTYLIKLDAGINMYHHFCDFINLYASQHLNNTFNQNINIVVWDTSAGDFWSYFLDTWRVFTNKKLTYIRSFDKKKVCFKDVVFPLLARMRFGLYYNMPLVYGCQNTGLFKSFSEHILHRLRITQNGPLEEKLRVTLLARKTQYRNILNQDKLVSDMRKKLKDQIELTVVAYDTSMPFIDQLRHTHNTDIFMSMHGAGLTHLLFLPDWAAVFEIHNCDDKDCYQDLARLRGVGYFTWETENKAYPQDEGKHPQLGTPHKKFTNYSFDSAEFIRMVRKMIKYVKKNPKFIKAHQEKFENEKKTIEKQEL